MIKIFKNKSIVWKSLGLWTMFSIAVMRGLSLIDINFYLYYLIIPGLLFSTYLLYYFLKTGTLLKFANFIISIILISLGFYLFEIGVKAYVSLNYNEEDTLRFTIFFLVSVFWALLSYFIIYLIKKINKPWPGQ